MITKFFIPESKAFPWHSENQPSYYNGGDSFLEISSKSPIELGVKLSAFNLKITTLSGLSMSVESAYQGSKVFESGGPHHDIYDCPPWEAKKDKRLRRLGKLVGFNFLGREYPISPSTIFYDWLWMIGLCQEESITTTAVLNLYESFTDRFYNEHSSIACQARSAAIYVGMSLGHQKWLDYDNIRLWDSFASYYTRGRV